MEIELMISSTTDRTVNQAYLPAVEEKIEWTTERRGSPGKLTFKVLRDDILHFSEGAAVRLQADGQPVFFGFVFTQKRDKGQMISVTAYDQLRYLKNKDTLSYENLTASQFIHMLAGDFMLNLGILEETGFVIAVRTEENLSLLEMIENALDLTLENSKEMFVLYDDAGKLTLKNIANMKVGEPGAYLMIDEESGENYEYTSSIDSDTYDKIKLTYDNEDVGVKEVYMAQDSAHMNEWGVLQYFDTLQKGENGQAKADALLQLYNQKTRNLKLTKVIGDNRVRAGSMLIVNLDLGDMKLMNFMLVETCKHIYSESEHWMDLTLRGGEFIA